MPMSTIEVGAVWTRLNATAAVEVEFLNDGPAVVQLTRGDGATPPAVDAPSFRFPVGFGVNGPITTVIRGGSGDYLWARAAAPSTVTIGWE